MMLVIVGFSLIAIDRPEASVQLHQARAEGDQAFTDVFEQDLKTRQKWRVATIVGAFAGGAAMTIVGFKAMAVR